MSEPVPTICWDDADSADDPRRIAPRAPLDREIELILLDAYDRPVSRHRLPASNLTRGGIGIGCDQPLALGCRVLVVLNPREAERGVKRLITGGTVRYCSARPADQRYHRVGIQFVPQAAMASAFANLSNWRLSA